MPEQPFDLKSRDKRALWWYSVDESADLIHALLDVAECANDFVVIAVTSIVVNFHRLFEPEIGYQQVVRTANAVVVGP